MNGIIAFYSFYYVSTIYNKDCRKTQFSAIDESSVGLFNGQHVKQPRRGSWFPQLILNPWKLIKAIKLPNYVVVKQPQENESHHARHRKPDN